MSATPTGRDREGFNHYFAQLARPTDRDRWAGFYHARSESANYGYRFQLAFAAYAVAALEHVPVPRPDEAMERPSDSPGATPVDEAISTLDALLDRFAEHRVWGYYPGPDPLYHENVQFAGHLACVLTAIAALDPTRSATKVALLGPTAEPTAHQCDLDRLVVSFRQQMAASPSGGICCEPGYVYSACNDHALIALAARSGPRWPDEPLIQRWLDFLRQRLMVGPGRIWPRGLFRVAYVSPQDRALPVSLDFTDAWTLAFLSPVGPDLVDDLAPRLWNRLNVDGVGAHLGAPPLADRIEVANAALATGFAYVLAREIGAEDVARDLRRWATHRLRPTWQGDSFFFDTEPRPYVTALFALGDALAPRTLGRVFGIAPR